MIGPQAAVLPDGKRLHLQHGPIDLIIEAFGSPDQVEQCYARAVEVFDRVLKDLVDELPELRSSDKAAYMAVTGPVARRMVRAVSPHSSGFVTPMASVAGSVADHVLQAMIAGCDLDRAYVNNGGDCALFLSPGESMKLAAIAEQNFGAIEVEFGDPVRGIATSGWRGRSHSFGIADAVTVLAQDAAKADVAATLIANSVDLPGHPAISRTKAAELNPDSDLGDRLVTTNVGPLLKSDVEAALDCGLKTARDMKERGLIEDALLFLNGETRQLTNQRKLAYA